MGIHEFSVEKTNRNLTQLGNFVSQRCLPDPYEEAPRAKGAPATSYDSLLDSRRILLSHKMTILRFAALGLLAAILITLLQTPIYRARTSIEIQDFNENFLDIKS